MIGEELGLVLVLELHGWGWERDFRFSSGGRVSSSEFSRW